MSDIIYTHNFSNASSSRANNSKLTAFNANAVDDNTMEHYKATAFVDAFGRLVSSHSHSAMAEAARVRAAGFMAALNDYQARN